MINSGRQIFSRVLLGCSYALTLFRFLSHLSATLFSNDVSLLPNKCLLLPLRADPVHLSEISLFTRAPVFFQNLNHKYAPGQRLEQGWSRVRTGAGVDASTGNSPELWIPDLINVHSCSYPLSASQPLIFPLKDVTHLSSRRVLLRSKGLFRTLSSFSLISSVNASTALWTSEKRSTALRPHYTVGKASNQLFSLFLRLTYRRCHSFVKDSSRPWEPAPPSLANWAVSDSSQSVHQHPQILRAHYKLHDCCHPCSFFVVHLWGRTMSTGQRHIEDFWQLQ